MDTSENNMPFDAELQLLNFNKQDGEKYRERRSEDWRENYTLYRNRVLYNRITQRQTVNLPLMKQTIRSLLKDIDDMPVIEFQNLDNDKQAEVFQNEYWRWTIERNKMELKDIQDKKQDLFFGRTFDQMQIIDGWIQFRIIDPEDILVSRFMDSSELDSSRFLIHTHIFRPLSVIAANPAYDQEAVNDLKTYYTSDHGLIKAKENEQSLILKNQRLGELGVTDIDDPILGETYVELSLHFIYRKEEGDTEEQLYLYVEADGLRRLQKIRLEELIGKTEDHYWRNHYPYNTWADDIDAQDFWTDGVADIVRDSNKVLNTWYSQMIEARTLRSFGMHYVDGSIEGFEPQTWQPMPFGSYKIPVPEGKSLGDVFQKVDIPDLSESLPEMEYVENMAAKASGATAALQGEVENKQVTLGEVQIAVDNAKERIRGMAKYYTQCWKDRATKFLKFIEAAPDKLDAVKIYKKGRNSDNMYTREISPPDWMTKSGYTTRIWDQAQKNETDTKNLEKLNAVKANMPDNPKVDEVYKRKLLEFAGMSPEEINEAMQFEERKRQMQEAMMAAQMGGGGMPGQPQLPGAPSMPALPPGPGGPAQPMALPPGAPPGP